MRYITCALADHCGPRAGHEQRWNEKQRPRDRPSGGGVAQVAFAQAHLGRDVLLRAGHVEAAGPVDAGRTGTPAYRQRAGGHVHAPRGQAGRTVEHVLPALSLVGVRPERAAVRAPVAVAHQSAALVFRVQDRPAAGRGRRGRRGGSEC